MREEDPLRKEARRFAGWDTALSCDDRRPGHLAALIAIEDREVGGGSCNLRSSVVRHIHCTPSDGRIAVSKAV